MREKLNRLRREVAELASASMFDKPKKAERALVTALELLEQLVEKNEKGEA